MESAHRDRAGQLAGHSGGCDGPRPGRLADLRARRASDLLRQHDTGPDLRPHAGTRVVFPHRRRGDGEPHRGGRQHLRWLVGRQLLRDRCGQRTAPVELHGRRPGRGPPAAGQPAARRRDVRRGHHHLCRLFPATARQPTRPGDLRRGLYAVRARRQRRCVRARGWLAVLEARVHGAARAAAGPGQRREPHLLVSGGRRHSRSLQRRCRRRFRLPRVSGVGRREHRQPPVDP